jgi:hypothetical protein
MFADRLVSGQEVGSANQIAQTTGIPRSLIGLHSNCEVLCNTWNLSNLYNRLSNIQDFHQEFLHKLHPGIR